MPLGDGQVCPLKWIFCLSLVHSISNGPSLSTCSVLVHLEKKSLLVARSAFQWKKSCSYLQLDFALSPGAWFGEHREGCISAHPHPLIGALCRCISCPATYRHPVQTHPLPLSNRLLPSSLLMQPFKALEFEFFEDQWYRTLSTVPMTHSRVWTKTFTEKKGGLNEATHVTIRA